MRRAPTVAVLAIAAFLTVIVPSCGTTPDGEDPPERDPLVYVASGRLVYIAGLDICSDLVRLELLDADEAATAEEVRWHLAAALDEAQATVEAKGALEYLTLRDALNAAQRMLVRVIEHRLTEVVDEPAEELEPEDGTKVENRRLMALLLAASHLLSAGLQIESQATVSPEEMSQILERQAAAERRWSEALASTG